MLTTKDLSFVGYTYKNFDAVKEGLRQSFGMSSDYLLWPWEQFLVIFLEVSLLVFFLNVRVHIKLNFRNHFKIVNCWTCWVKLIVVFLNTTLTWDIGIKTLLHEGSKDEHWFQKKKFRSTELGLARNSLNET